MAAVEEGNHSHVADDIDRCVSQINCSYHWQLWNYYPMILNRRHGVVGSQTGNPVEPYWRSLVDIHLSTCYATKAGCNPLQLEVDFVR